MGITGLIPFIEKASSKVHLKELKGSTVAIDTYCWLHKGVFSCAEKLARGEDTDQYVIYCIKYVQMLLSFDIKPILVFDGMHLPAKALTEKRRRESRRESKKRAAELLRLGKIEEARSHMRRCVDVTHEMALRLIREMRQRNVDCIVAPYEADAQMAWLNKVGIAQYVITEDSDLTLFGASSIIFKLDLSGNGLLVQAEKLHLAMGCNLERYTFDKFRRMCILSGCDYLDSLPGIGLAKACKFFLKTEQDDMKICLKKLPQYLNMKQLQVDDDYIESFLKAEATFRHMYIFNPHKRKMERLNDLSVFQTDEGLCSNAGTLLDNDEVALNLALGNLNPFTLKQLDTYHPDRDFGLAQAPAKNIKRAKHKSIWQTSNVSNNSVTKRGATTVDNSCALYFKKVDFISTTIEQDLNESLCEENAKPAEAEIFAMYRNEEADNDGYESNAIKRRRLNVETCSPNSEVAINNGVRHNPFAKQTSNEEGCDMLKASAVCANSSLLKVLSPKKCKNQDPQESTKRFQRNIFVKENRKVEIRSRFFAENIKLTTAATTTTMTANIVTATPINQKDLSEEIESIERLKQELTKKQALLYNSPSPDKSAKKHSQLSHTDSGIESLNTEESNLPVSRKNDSLNGAALNMPAQNPIEISDEDTNDDHVADKLKTKDCTSKSNAAIKNKVKLDVFKPQKRPRLGLSKPKATTTKGQNLKAKSSSNPDQNQPRLSMFGFQKRPTLKLE